MYDQIAQIYDLLHAAVKDDIPLILEVADRAGGPILELGSGTGRLVIPLARGGYRVVGIENSAAMIEQALRNIGRETEHVQARISMVRADLRTFRTGERFALALIGYNTLMHFSPDQVNMFIPALREMLLPDGRLLIDLANPFELFDQDEDSPDMEQIVRDEKRGVSLKMVYSSVPGSDQMSRRIRWEAVSGKYNEKDIRPRFEAELRYYYPHEIELMLSSGGFQTEAIYGNYDGSPFSESSPRLILLAKRAA